MSRIFLPAVLVLLSGCASGGGPAEAGEAFVLSAGEAAALGDGASLRYVGAANDSRCPPRVQCIRAGDADVLFDVVRPDGAPARVVLNSGRLRAAPAGRWTLHLVELAPGASPRATLRIEAGSGP